MPLDASIILAGKPLTPSQDMARQRQSIDLQNQQRQQSIETGTQRQELNDLGIAQQRFKNLSSRDQLRVNRSATTALKLKPFLQAGNTEAVRSILQDNMARIAQDREAGVEIDDQDTRAALQMLEAGDLDALNQSVDGLIQVGRMTGALQSPSFASQGGATGVLLNRIQDDMEARTGERPSLEQAVLISKGITGERARAEQDISYGKNLGKGLAEQATKPKLTETLEGIKTNAEAGRPLPAPIQKANSDQRQDLQTSYNIVQDVDGVINQINTGALNLGVYANAVNKAANGLALSSEESVNLNRFEGFLEKLRNEQLRLNTGVQTDGDAERALNEIISNKTDPNIVKARLNDIKKFNERGVEQRLGTFKDFLKENKRNMPKFDELFGSSGGVFDDGAQQPETQQSAPQSSGGFKIIRRVN